MDDLWGRGLADVMDALDAGTVSSAELTRAVLDEIRRRDGELGAFVAVTDERALAEAAQADRERARGRCRGPLHGVPYAVKDLFDVAGEATMAGCHLLADKIADRDAAAVARLAEAGAVLVGKTHTVQFAYGGVGINHDLGSPRNPWRTDEAYVAGGSSSGSAVAVAAGMVPFALGTDTSGSVRIPASLCGLSGLKTTVGRISRAGVYPLSPTLDSVGPLARSVPDCALIFDALVGADPVDPASLAMTHDPIGEIASPDLSGLRLAMIETMFFDGVDPEVAAAVTATAEVFVSLGAEVISIEAPEVAEVMGSGDTAYRALTVAAEGYVTNRDMIEHHVDELDPVVATRMLPGRDLSAVEFLMAHEDWKALRASFGRRTAGIDGYLVPATMLPARPIAEIDASPEDYVRHNLAYLRNTSVGNRLHWCGYSVPCGLTTDGLPIGLMIHTPAATEAVATRIASAYQSVTDWHRRRP